MDYGLKQQLSQAIEELEKAGCETPKLDAEVLLAHALGCERHEIYTGPETRDQRLETEKLKVFENFIERRKKREPVAYIRGFKEFWSMPIKVNPDVLIPRPETEMLVEEAIQRFTGRTILDLCTGSGCIATALAKEFPAAQIVVSDISEKALEVAKENLKFAQDRVLFIQSDLFKNISGSFDLIVSNPPYLHPSELKTLMPDVGLYEPRLALDGGPEGLDFMQKIVQDAANFLNPNGWLVLENGPKIETWNTLSLKGGSPFKGL